MTPVFRKYLRIMTTVTAILVLACVALNAIVDPYAVFGSDRIEGFNPRKPYAVDRARIGKLYQVERTAPAGLIVGNSRPQMGLAPTHACWPEAGRPAYNIALPGLSVYKQVRYAQHGMAHGDTNTVVMAVDFLDFLWKEPAPLDPIRWPPAHANPGSEPYAVDPSGRSRSGFTWTRLSDYTRSSASVETLGHSALTVLRQRGGATQSLTAAGFHAAGPYYRSIVRVEGTCALFAQKNRQIANRLAGAEWRLTWPGGSDSPDFRAVRELVSQARARGAETVLFINPYHVEYLLLVDAAGLWPVFEQWKRLLAGLARSLEVPLWDFSGINRYSTELVSTLAPRGESLRWFWEPAHYRRELGDLVLARVFEEHCPQNQARDGSFGFRLDTAEDGSLARHIKGQRQALETFKARHPSVAQRISGLFQAPGP